MDNSDPNTTDLATLHFHKWGSGTKALFAFHGFGQQAEVWKSFLQVWGKEYTIYAFDLFFHGKSKWNVKNDTLNSERWISLFQDFLHKSGIEEFSLAGYSMGGKFALSIWQALPNKTKKIYLFAPDGLKTRKFYWLTTAFPFSRVLFRWVIHKPTLFFQLIDWLGIIRVINPSLQRFVASQMNTRSRRLLVYNTWVTFRGLTIDVQVLADHIKQFKTPVEVFMGKYDKVITKKHILPLARLVPSLHIIWIDAGHTNLLAHSSDYLLRERLRNSLGAETP